jgi:hypothetical protein
MKKISFYTGPARERTRPTALARGPRHTRGLLSHPARAGADSAGPQVRERRAKGEEGRDSGKLKLADDGASGDGKSTNGFPVTLRIDQTQLG